MVGGSEAARLYASVGADIDEFTRGMARADKEVHEFAKTKATARVDVDTSPAETKLSGLKSTMSKFGQGIVGGVVGAASFMGFNLIAQGIQATATAMIGGAAQMESYRLQFEVLLGSVDAAKTRMAQLAEFAKVTPFELPQVVDASRILQVFGGDAIATGKSLTLIGDVAAGVNRPFEETALWFGRMYSAMKAGQPFGEATMRLSEMGAMSGETRTRIEALAAGVKSGSVTMDQAWTSVSAEFAKFGGLMEKQSASLQGKWSNLMDSMHQKLTSMGEAAAPMLKTIIDLSISLSDFLVPAILGVTVVMGALVVASLPITGTMLAIGAAVAVMATAFTTNLLGIRDIATTVFGVIATAVKGFLDLILDAARGMFQLIANIPGPWQEAANDVIASINSMDEGLEHFGEVTQQQAEAIRDAEWAKGITDAVPDVKNAAAAMGAGIASGVGAGTDAAVKDAAKLPEEIGAAIRANREGWVGSFKQFLTDLKSAMTPAQEAGFAIGALTSKQLKQGLHSGDAALKAESYAMANSLLDNLTRIAGPAWVAGHNFGDAYINGLITSKLGQLPSSRERQLILDGMKDTFTPEKPTADDYKAIGWDWGTSLDKGLSTGISSGAGEVQTALDRLKAKFETFKAFLATWPAVSAAGIHTALAKTISQLSALWGDMTSGEQYSAIQAAGEQITAQEKAAAAPPEAQAIAAEIDRLRKAIETNLKYAANVPAGSKRQKYLDLAAEYSHRIDEMTAQMNAIIDAAKTAAEDASSAAVGTTTPVASEPDYGNAVAPSTEPGGYGGASTTYNINVGADIDINGPVLDPYGDYAQRLAAMLIPGIQRELQRQGISL